MRGRWWRGRGNRAISHGVVRPRADGSRREQQKPAKKTDERAARERRRETGRRGSGGGRWRAAAIAREYCHLLGDVVHNDRRSSASIVHWRQTMVPLLARRVPYFCAKRAPHAPSQFAGHANGKLVALSPNLTVVSFNATVCVRNAAAAAQTAALSDMTWRAHPIRPPVGCA